MNADQSSHRTMLTLAMVGVLLLGTLPLTVGTASAGSGFTAPYGFTTPDGSFVYVYWEDFLLQSNSLSPGNLVYGDQLYIEFGNSLANRSIGIVVNQSGHALNFTANVLRHGWTEIDYSLPSTASKAGVALCIDGGCIRFFHQTPAFALPGGFETVGGLTLLLLVMIFMLAGFTGFFAWLAKRVHRRVQWTPRISPLHFALTVPHGLLWALILWNPSDPNLGNLFAIGEFVGLPISGAFIVGFWFTLRTLNKAKPAIAFQIDTQKGHGVLIWGWEFWVGTNPWGWLVAIDFTFRTWFFRLLGRYTKIEGPEAVTTEHGPAAAIEVFKKGSAFPAVLQSERNDRLVRRALNRFDPVFRQIPGHRSMYEKFPIQERSGGFRDTKRGDFPELFYLVPHDVDLRLYRPYVSMRKLVEVAEYDKTGAIVRYVKKAKLAWPHIVEPPTAGFLAGIYAMDVMVASVYLDAVQRLAAENQEQYHVILALEAALIKLVREKTSIGVNEVITLIKHYEEMPTEEELLEETRDDAGPERGTDEPEPGETDPAMRPKPEQVVAHSPERR